MIVQPSFVNGWINEQTEFRLDSKLSQSAMAECQNCIVSVSGSVFRRPGTDFVASIPNAIRIVPYFHMGDGTYYLIVFKSGGKVGLYSTAGVQVASDITDGNLYEANTVNDVSIVIKDNVVRMAGGGKRYQKITITPTTSSPPTAPTTIALAVGVLTGTAAWDATNSAKWPTRIAEWRGKLWLWGQNEVPGRLAASKSNNFEDFTTTPGGTEDIGIDWILGTPIGVGAWLNGGEVLHLGATQAELIYKASVEGKLNPPATAPQFTFRSETNSGSDNLLSFRLTEGVAFFNGNQLRILTYTTEKQKWESTSISDFVPITGSFIAGAIQTLPFTILWLVNSNGELYGLTIDSKQGVLAWHRHATLNEIAPLDSGDGLFKSIAITRDRAGQNIFFLVQRKVNGSYVTYLEKMRNITAGNQVDSACVDSAVTNSNTGNQTQLADHLVGKTVQVMEAGGNGQPQIIALSVPVSGKGPLTVGLGFTSRVKLPAMRTTDQRGELNTKPMPVKVKAVVSKTGNIKIGVSPVTIMGLDTTSASTALDRTWNDSLTTAPTWTTGEVESMVNGREEVSRIYFENVGPLRFEILSAITETK